MKQPYTNTPKPLMWMTLVCSVTSTVDDVRALRKHYT